MDVGQAHRSPLTGTRALSRAGQLCRVQSAFVPGQ